MEEERSWSVNSGINRERTKTRDNYFVGIGITVNIVIVAVCRVCSICRSLSEGRYLCRQSERSESEWWEADDGMG